jgi:hypothetical protein
LENATHKLQKMSYIHAVRDGVGGLMRGGECGLGGTGQAWAKKMKRRKQETKPNPGNQQNLNPRAEPGFRLWGGQIDKKKKKKKLSRGQN